MDTYLLHLSSYAGDTVGEKTLIEVSFPPIHHCRLISCLHMLPLLPVRLIFL